MTKQMPNCGMAAKLAPDTAVNTGSNPFCVSRAAVMKVDYAHDRVGVDTNLLQTRAPTYTATNANAAAHRKVGSVQYGMARMY